MRYSATKLRHNLYNILDRVIEKGEIVEVERKGHVLTIAPEMMCDLPRHARGGVAVPEGP